MDKNIKKIIILDFNSTVTHVFDFNENLYNSEEIQDFLDAINNEYDLYLKESECQWMITDELKLKIH